MSTTVVALIIILALGIILSNIMLLRDTKRFDLPQSYKDRKAAEAKHLAQVAAEESSTSGQRHRRML